MNTQIPFSQSGGPSVRFILRVALVAASLAGVACGGAPDDASEPSPWSTASRETADRDGEPARAQGDDVGPSPEKRVPHRDPASVAPVPSSSGSASHRMPLPLDALRVDERRE